MNVVRLKAGDQVGLEDCARLMAGSEPWITLRRSFDAAMAVLQDPGKEVYAVLNGQSVSAFIILDMRGPLSGYIQTIGVQPDQRGCGLGTTLIRWAEERIARDSPNVFLCVSSFNVSARRLYERLGYQVVGNLADFIVRGHDELLLRKTCAPWSEFRPAPTKVGP
jgi:ribosomal-protein-alanine N-acetyltransferase